MIAFFQKYLIYILLALLAVAVVFGGIQYVRVLKKDTTIKEQKATIASQVVTIADLNGQVADYKAQVEKVKKIQKKKQAISDNTAGYQAQIAELKTKCLLEGSGHDKKILDGFVSNFNAGGLLPVPKAGSGTEADIKSVR
jgi:cell division protein FtsB